MRAAVALAGMFMLGACDNVTIVDRSAVADLPMNADGTFNHDLLPEFCPDGSPMAVDAACVKDGVEEEPPILY